MKILSVGNSFSENAQRWLHDIALCGGDEIDTFNLFIGGCALETHCECITGKKADYLLEGNGNSPLRTVTANEVIENERFDVVTVQQASGYSGRPQSYIPYITWLAAYIRAHQPEAALYFHETWSYEVGADHPHFAFYDRDRKEMDRRIADCAAMAGKLIDARVIPAGDFIRYLRENTEAFRYPGGGISLCCDGFHLTEDYGCFAAGAVWYKTLTGKVPDAERFLSGHAEFDPEPVNVIIESLTEFPG